MEDLISNILFTASVWVLPVLIAITLHEAAHGYVANNQGSDREADGPRDPESAFSYRSVWDHHLAYLASFQLGSCWKTIRLWRQAGAVTVSRLNNPRET